MGISLTGCGSGSRGRIVPARGVSRVDSVVTGLMTRVSRVVGGHVAVLGSCGRIVVSVG